ncbi:hypothetical protein L202_03806 [Cryptococcus amylolentus CBS 6039]|uniref:Uncharacterized protein n=2 Tax=Cryptococcus amylolentus TaxID=104669 RepID=A0A1E3HUA6_9TREE|nr:hypothetical protein L202_03806 [Cryptococcus amylolentus CBS 6039]ODN79917.1 hypothetical protein L202_03806 [Cryptococcus amylolentus CBS 6039]ODO08174.1 hypothetical protein I350_03763 [Cryptococcus amylolentus CBS 6273]
MATATMDDLVASLSGNMHVSQEGYDLKALQEYLSQNLPLPMAPPSGGLGYPQTTSRSTSLTRKPSSLPSYTYPSPTPNALPLPSPYAQPQAQCQWQLQAQGQAQEQQAGTSASASYDPPSQISNLPPAQRPAPPRRASSFGTLPHSYIPACSSGQQPSSPSTSYAAFESDAFAPIWKAEESAGVEDPWAKIRAGQGQLGAFGYAHAQGGQKPTAAQDNQAAGGGGWQWGLQIGVLDQPTPLSLGQEDRTGGEDMDMDEDSMMDASDDEDDEEVEGMMDERDPWGAGRGRPVW